MKKLFLSVFLSMSILIAFSQFGTSETLTITNAGLTKTYTSSSVPNTIYITTGAITLSNNIAISYSAMPSAGYKWRVYVNATINFNGHTFTLFTQPIPQHIFAPSQPAVTQAYFDFNVVYKAGGNVINYTYCPVSMDTVFTGHPMVDGHVLFDESVPIRKLEGGNVPVSAFDTIGRGRIIEGGVAGVATTKFFGTNGYIGIGDGTDFNSVAQTGDVIYSNAGVSAIQAGVILNADINGSAAITRSKTAVGSANYVLINSAGGVMTEEQYLATSRGGLAQDGSAATGFVSFLTGTATIGTMTDVRGLDNLSLVTAAQGIYYLYFPFAATATNINCRVTSVVSGTDNGFIEVANNSGTVMAGSSLTAGQLTIAASAAFGTGYSSTLTSNNTFTSTQSLRLTTSKVTSGGVLHCDVTYTRTQ